MNTSRIFQATAMAGLLGLGSIAFAQGTTSVPAAPDPAKSGQASTKTPAGVPNPTQRPDGSAPASREAVKAEARVENRNSANSMTPKGEASTTINHQPNATPRTSGDMSRADVRQDAKKQTPKFGQTGERPEVPTNPTDRTGTPK
jgi:hypothetical protein